MPESGKKASNTSVLNLYCFMSLALWLADRWMDGQTDKAKIKRTISLKEKVTTAHQIETGVSFTFRNIDNILCRQDTKAV